MQERDEGAGWAPALRGTHCTLQEGKFCYIGILIATFECTERSQISGMRNPPLVVWALFYLGLEFPRYEELALILAQPIHEETTDI